MRTENLEIIENSVKKKKGKSDKNEDRLKLAVPGYADARESFMKMTDGRKNESQGTISPRLSNANPMAQMTE
jgi:hypothetical protein